MAGDLKETMAGIQATLGVGGLIHVAVSLSGGVGGGGGDIYGPIRLDRCRGEMMAEMVIPLGILGALALFVVLWDIFGPRRRLSQATNNRGIATSSQTDDGAESIPYRASPDFSALIDTIRAEGRAYRAEEKSEDIWGKVLEIITIVVLAATLGALVATYYAIRDQVREMAKVYTPIETQANATKDMAEASVNAQRAWIGGYDASLIGALNPDGVTYQKISAGKTFSVRMQYRNAGGEPARNMLITDPVAKNL